MCENIKKIKIKRPRNGRWNNKLKKKKSKNFMEMEVIKLRKQNGKCLQREMPRIQQPIHPVQIRKDVKT